MRPALVVYLVAAILVLIVGSQLLLPPLIAGEVSGRLTSGGGRADVRLEALPALRLLAGDGDRIEVEASGLELDLPEVGGEAFERLDGFGAVDLAISDSTVGPFEIGDVTLTRQKGDDQYALALIAEVSPQDVADFAAGQLPGGLGGLGRLASGQVPDVPVPIELDATVESDGGSIRLTEGAGTIAGVPAGPVVEAVAGAIVSRL